MPATPAERRLSFTESSMWGLMMAVTSEIIPAPYRTTPEGRTEAPTGVGATGGLTSGP